MPIIVVVMLIAVGFFIWPLVAVALAFFFSAGAMGKPQWFLVTLMGLILIRSYVPIQPLVLIASVVFVVWVVGRQPARRRR